MAPGILDSFVRPTAYDDPKPRAQCKIGINGFGRIGRCVFRASLEREDLEVVAINHTCASIDDLIHLILYDSTHGRLAKSTGYVPQAYALENGNLHFDGREIVLSNERDLSILNWSLSGAQYIAECTGKFKTTELANHHIYCGGAKRVVISAPSPDAPAFIYKVNSDSYSPESTAGVVSCASCTTNCAAPMVKVLNEDYGIIQGILTTIHASTRSQSVLDGYSKRDRRTGRAALGNIIPTTTGAAKAISQVLPELTGRLTGISIRVPTTNVSMVDLTVHTSEPTSLQEIISSYRLASKTSLSGVLGVTDAELVSSDFLGHPCSAVIDVHACVELNPQFFKIIAWYDNEWAYSSRLLDLLAMMAKRDFDLQHSRKS